MFLYIAYILLSIELLLMTTAKAQDKQNYTIYCVANRGSLDVTSGCSEVNKKNPRSFTCTYVPGEIIPCTDYKNNSFNCLIISYDFFNGVTFQGLLSCNSSKKISSKNITTEIKSTNFDSDSFDN